jgi:hypothetical protein
MKRSQLASLFLTLSLSLTASAESLLILAADGLTTHPVAEMTANGFTVSSFDTTADTPTIAFLSGFDAILAYTNHPPADGEALGDVLAAYYGLGGKALTITTFAFGTPWAITGDVMMGSNAGLTNVGLIGEVSGSLVATVADPIFSGVDLTTLEYYLQNSNFAHPGLAPGATLLATDGAGINMIARSANGIMNLNFYPGFLGPVDPTVVINNAEFYKLLSNTLRPGGQTQQPVPEPSSVILLGTIAAGFAYQLKRRRLA